MRKKKHPEHVNHERWLISYADFITLLFAFFVVMFAVSQVDTKKLGHFTEAFSKAVGISVMPLSGSSLLEGASAAEEKESSGSEQGTGELDQLGSSLSEMAGLPGGDPLRNLQVIRRGNELILRLPENVFFDTGDARVRAAAVGTLKLIAPKLSARRVEVRVEGYTDDRPIVSGRYRSNWELSTARALGVMTVLVGEGVLPERVSIAGYGEYRPLAANSTDEGRKQNRRVDLVVTPLRAVQEVDVDTHGNDVDSGATVKGSSPTPPAQEPEPSTPGDAE
ncbi:MAG: flagellar motor protein MotB [Polyangiaceae bacterium]|jgi:chemotaxis protein MotB